MEALGRGEPPERELEPLPPEVRECERLLLGLRLDEPVPVGAVGGALDRDALERMRGLGLAELARAGPDGAELLSLTPRGRFLGGGVTAELLS